MKIPKMLQKHITKNNLLSLDNSDNSIILRGNTGNLVIEWRKTGNKKQPMEYAVCLVDSDDKLINYYKTPKKAIHAFYKGIQLRTSVKPANNYKMSDELYAVYNATDMWEIACMDNCQWEYVSLNMSKDTDCLTTEVYADGEELVICIFYHNDQYVISCEGVTDRIVYTPNIKDDPEEALKLFNDRYGKAFGINLFGDN